jgi:hypothetical protein
MNQIPRTFFLFALLLLLGVGCKRSGPPLPVTYLVTGQIRFNDGQPVANALVEFQPTGKQPLTTQGATDGDGKFAIETLVENVIVDGAPEGEYRILVHLPSEDQAATPIMLRERFVVQPKDNHFNIQVEPPRR